MNEPSEISAPAPSRKGLLVLVIVLAVAAIATAAYFLLLRGGGAKTSLLSRVAPLSDQCKYNEPDLCKFINNWKKIKYFTATLTSTFEGKPIKHIIKSVGDDRSQIISVQGENEDMNIISIGNDTYAKDYTDNKWLHTHVSQC